MSSHHYHGTVGSGIPRIFEDSAGSGAPLRTLVAMCADVPSHGPLAPESRRGIIAQGGSIMQQWWVMGKDRTPIGPVTTELVLQGIRAGRVPSDSLACEVGGPEWKSIRELEPFVAAFAKLRIDGPTLVDAVPPLLEPTDAVPAIRAALRTFDDTVEHTIADVVPLRPSSPPLESLPAPLERFDEVSEHTVVDAPLSPSEPPA